MNEVMSVDSGIYSKITKMLQSELNAHDVVFLGTEGEISCMKIGERYVRIDSFPAIDKGTIICIETATEELAQKGIFEDAFTYWDGDGLETILKQMKNDLSQ